MKSKMVLGGIAKEGIKIYYRQQRDKRIFFYLGIFGLTLFYSLITGDWQLSLVGLMFSTITITLDGATTYESGGSEYNRIARLDDNKFVIAFRDINDSNKGKVIIGTRSGSTISITLDSAITFEEGATNCIDIDVFDSAHFVIAYKDIDDSNYIKAIAGSVSGTVISLGSVVIVSIAPNLDWAQIAPAIVALDTTNFVLVYTYRTSPTRGAYRVCSLSGITITLGDQILDMPNVDNFYYPRAKKLDTTKFVIFYSGTHDFFAVGTADTTEKTVSWGNPVYMDLDYFPHSDISVFNATSFVWVGAENGEGQARIGTISGTTITFGNFSSFNAAVSTNISVVAMDETHFVVAYRDEGNLNKGTIRGASKEGTTITWDDDGEIVFESGDVTYVTICKMISNYFAIAFKDNG